VVAIHYFFFGVLFFVVVWLGWGRLVFVVNWVFSDAVKSFKVLLVAVECRLDFSDAV